MIFIDKKLTLSAICSSKLKDDPGLVTMISNPAIRAKCPVFTEWLGLGPGIIMRLGWVSSRRILVLIISTFLHFKHAQIGLIHHTAQRRQPFSAESPRHPHLHYASLLKLSNWLSANEIKNQTLYWTLEIWDILPRIIGWGIRSNAYIFFQLRLNKVVVAARYV